MSTTTYSDRTPKWRSLSSKKKPKAATSVSLIFAQPQQGAPLRSAVDNLPAVGIDDSASFVSEMSRKRERLQSMSSAMTLGDQSFVGKEDSGSVHKRSRVGSIASAAEITPAEQPNLSEAVIDLTKDEPMTAESTNTPVQVLTESPEQSPSTTLLSTNDPTPTVPFPSQEHVEPPVQPPPARSSWFTSFSRSKGKDKASSPPTPIASVEPSYTVRLPVSSDQPPASSVSSQTTPGSCQSESTSAAGPIPVPTALYPRDPSPATPKIVGSPAQGTSNTTSISSVDDEVPRLKSLGNSPSNQASLAETVAASALRETTMNRKPSMTSLSTASPSGFMLRIPLLGRPKIPLNEAVAAAAVNPPMEPSIAENPAPTEDEQIAAEPTPVTEEIQVPNKDDVVVGLPGDQPQSTSISSQPEDGTNLTVNHDQQTPPASGWWAYLGLGGSSIEPLPSGQTASAEESPQETNLQKVDPSEPPSAGIVHKSNSCPDLRVTPATPEGVTPHPSNTDIASQGDAKPKVSPADGNSEPAHNSQGNPDTQGRPASLFSADTAQSQGSAWYSPWAWYYGSPPLVPTSATSEPTAVDAVQPEGDNKTESELVKEEALARDEPTPPLETPDPQPVPEPSSMLMASNPIESTISTNRSGWASFFMSRALLTKSITDETTSRDEDGMEVMNIDDDDDVNSTTKDPIEPSKSPVTSVASTAGKEIVVDKKQQSGSVPVSPPGSPTRPQSSKQKEPKKSGAPAVPLTNSESIKRDTTKPKSTTAAPPRTASPTPSQKSTLSSPGTPARTQQPNLVLPTWSDTFRTLPRSYVPPPPPKPSKSKLSKTFSFVSNALFSADGPPQGSAKGKEREQLQRDVLTFGQGLPKALDILGHPQDPHLVDGNCRVVVIGVAGWSPGAVTRTIAGGLPSSSNKFVDMTCSALEKFEQDHNIKFKKITKIPLEGDGTISRKVAKVHAHLLSKHEWIEDLHLADVIFVAAHSQGSVVSIHLLDKLIREGHILTPRNIDILNTTAAMVAPGGAAPASTARTQRICCLALCGIHLGPLRYLKTSSLLQPYIQYFENAAARELFEFQNTESQLSKDYVNALRTVMEHGAKVVYVASLNDQVVPIYSGLFTAASHPRILRALYIDGDAYHSSDFLSNLLVLLIRIMNAGLSDSGLLAHLSEATAGTLSGVGHSTPYEELATFSLAVDYMFMVNDGADVRSDLLVEPFNAVNEQNDYEIPWSLRDLIADERVAMFFAKEFAQLRDAFDDWSPKTTILRDIKRKLQPIQRLSTIRGGSFSNSKL